MIGRFYDNLGAKETVICSYNTTSTDENTKVSFLPSGRLFSYHAMSQTMTIAPVVIPRRNPDGSVNRPDIAVLHNSISRHTADDGPDEYFELFPSGMCFYKAIRNEDNHLEEFYAVADAKLNHVKIINIDDWHVQQVIGTKGSGEGEFSNISDVCVFSVLNQTYLCTSELGNNRIQIFNDKGGFVTSIGVPRGGHGIGFFRQPVSVTAYFPASKFFKPSLVEGEFPPPWYVGQRTKEALQRELAHRSAKPGSFLVSMRTQTGRNFDLVFLNENEKFGHRVIKFDPYCTNGKPYYIDGREEDRYVSVNHVVRSQRYLKKFGDPRPFVYVAVADQSNFRVQILKFYWINSDIYSPSLEPVTIIGGSRGDIVPLTSVSSVAYTSTGDLAIVDPVKNTIYILSPLFEVLRSMSIHYASPEAALSIHDAEVKKSETELALAVAPEAQPTMNDMDDTVDSLTASVLNEEDNFSQDEIRSRGRSPSPNSSPGKRNRELKSPMSASSKGSVTFTVGGSVTDEESIEKAEGTPAFHLLKHSYSVAHLPSYNLQSDPEDFHHLHHNHGHHGSESRHAGSHDPQAAPGLSAIALATAVVADLGVSTKLDTVSGNIESDEESKRHTPIPQSAAVVRCISFSRTGKMALAFSHGGVNVYDQFKKYAVGDFMVMKTLHFDHILDHLDYFDCCQLRNSCKYLHDVTRSRRATWRLFPMRYNARDHVIHMFLKYSRNKTGISCLETGFGLRDNESQFICRRHLELKCEGRGCSYSHKPSGTSIQDIVAQETYLEHLSFIVAANQVFGTKFMWKVEKFAEVLFEKYSIVVPIIVRTSSTDYKRRCDPHRDEHEAMARVLSLPNFLEIMCIFEEDRSGAKPIYCQPLFAKMTKQPLAELKDPYDRYNVDGRMYIDPIEQYNRGVGIPLSKMKPHKPAAHHKKRDQVIMGIECIQGIEGDLVRNHINAFNSQSVRLGGLMNKLFK